MGYKQWWWQRGDEENGGIMIILFLPSPHPQPLICSEESAESLVGESVGPGAVSHVHEGCWETLSPSCFKAQQAGKSGSRGTG